MPGIETERERRAFEEVVGRHIDMVYAAARRQVRDPGMAEDVTQGVFLLLARKGVAAGRHRGVAVAGWLLKATYYGCRAAVRRERRRRHYEEKAGRMRQEMRAEEAEWSAIEPVLDGALMRLNEVDREAVALRFLEGRSLREVGESLGISEEAARKRVERALGRLRGILERKGAKTTAGVGALLMAKGMEATPAGVHAAVGSGVGSAGAVGIAGAISKGMMWGMVKVAVTVGVVMVAAGVSAGILAARGRVPAMVSAPAALTVMTKAPFVAGKMEYRGILLDAAGNPAGGVPYRVWHWTWPELMVESLGKTGADGSFTSGMVVPDPARTINRQFVFDDSKSAYTWWSPETGRPQWGEGERLQLERGTVLAGMVTDDQGRAVEGATVEASLRVVVGELANSVHGYFEMNEQMGLAVRTDARGVFRFERVPAGARAHVKVKCPGYAIFSTAAGYFSDPYPIAAGTTDVEVRLEKGADVQVQLVHAGRGMAKAGVWIWASERSRAYGHELSQTDGTGRAQFQGLGPGTWDFLEQADGAPEEEQRVLPAIGVTLKHGDQREVQLGYDEGVLVKGVERDAETGKGGHAQVEIVLEEDRWATVRQLKPDDAGHFETRLGVGWYRIFAGGVTKRVHVGKNGLEEGLLELAVKAGRTLRGQLIDGAGQGVAGIVVVDDRSVETDSEGRFEMGEPQSDYGGVAGLALDRGMKLGKGFVYEPGQEGELKLVLTPMGAVTGHIEDVRPNGGGGKTDVRLMIRNGNSSWAPGWDSVWRTELRSDGSFRISPVPAGYEVDVMAEKEGLQAIHRIGGMDAGEEIDAGTLVLHAPGATTRSARRVMTTAPARVAWDSSVTGRVVDEEGRPVVGARIYGPDSDGMGASDLKGRFEVKGLPRDQEVELRGALEEEMEGSWRVASGARGLELKMLPMHHELLGKAPPALKVERWYTSGPASWEELRGKVVLLQVGQWRKRYFEESNDVAEIYERHKGEGLVVVTVFERSDSEGLEEAVAKSGMTWAVGLDANDPQAGNGAMYKEFGSVGEFLIDRKGIVRVSPGRMKLEGWVEKLLAEK